MLRLLFNESMRQDHGTFKQCMDLIDQFCSEIRKRNVRRSTFPRYYRLELTARAFVDAYDELEQSLYCTKRFAEGLKMGTTDGMTIEELAQYRRHLYFYKNSLIRVFSMLDKLGYFMNELFQAKTERVKSRFSYYTVLRHMRKRHLHPKLTHELNEYKTRYKKAMQQLRKKRNLEVHLINVEILDELMLKEKEWLEHQHIENIVSNMKELEQGYEMVTHTLLAIFKYACHNIRNP